MVVHVSLKQKKNKQDKKNLSKSESADGSETETLGSKFENMDMEDPSLEDALAGKELVEKSDLDEMRQKIEKLEWVARAQYMMIMEMDSKRPNSVLFVKGRTMDVKEYQRAIEKLKEALQNQVYSWSEHHFPARAYLREQDHYGTVVDKVKKNFRGIIVINEDAGRAKRQEAQTLAVKSWLREADFDMSQYMFSFPWGRITPNGLEDSWSIVVDNKVLMTCDYNVQQLEQTFFIDDTVATSLGVNTENFKAMLNADIPEYLPVSIVQAQGLRVKGRLPKKCMEKVNKDLIVPLGKGAGRDKKEKAKLLKA